MHRTLQNGMRGAVAGATLGLGAGLIYDVAARKARPGGHAGDGAAYPFLEGHGELATLVDMVANHISPYHKTFDELKKSLNRLCALDQLVSRQTKETVRPGWVAMAYHHASDVQDALRYILLQVHDRNTFETIAADIQSEINTFTFNISAITQDLMGA